MKNQVKTNQDGVVLDTSDHSDHRDDFIVEHLIIKKGVPIGDDGEVSVVEEYIESRKYNRQDYINSFRGEVGIINLLKKCNAGLLNPAVLAANFDVNVSPVNFADLPDDVGDAMSMVDQAHKLYASLPAALTKGMDFDTFCKTFDQKAFNEYIESVKPKNQEGDQK